MANCDDIQIEMSAYLDGEAAPSERAAVEAHVRECPACRAVLDDLAFAQGALAGLPKLNAPASLTSAIRQERANTHERTASPKVVSFESKHASQSWRPVLLGMAALLMAGVMIFLLLPLITTGDTNKTAMNEAPRPPAAASPRPTESARDAAELRKTEIPSADGYNKNEFGAPPAKTAAGDSEARDDTGGTNQAGQTLPSKGGSQEKLADNRVNAIKGELAKESALARPNAVNQADMKDGNANLAEAKPDPAARQQKSDELQKNSEQKIKRKDIEDKDLALKPQPIPESKTGDSRPAEAGSGNSPHRNAKLSPAAPPPPPASSAPAPAPSRTADTAEEGKDANRKAKEAESDSKPSNSVDVLIGGGKAAADAQRSRAAGNSNDDFSKAPESAREKYGDKSKLTGNERRDKEVKPGGAAASATNTTPSAEPAVRTQENLKSDGEKSVAQGIPNKPAAPAAPPAIVAPVVPNSPEVAGEGSVPAQPTDLNVPSSKKDSVEKKSGSDQPKKLADAKQPLTAGSGAEHRNTNTTRTIVCRKDEVEGIVAELQKFTAQSGGKWSTTELAQPEVKRELSKGGDTPNERHEASEKKAEGLGSKARRDLDGTASQTRTYTLTVNTRQKQPLLDKISALNADYLARADRRAMEQAADKQKSANGIGGGPGGGTTNGGGGVGDGEFGDGGPNDHVMGLPQASARTIKEQGEKQDTDKSTGGGLDRAEMVTITIEIETRP